MVGERWWVTHPWWGVDSEWTRHGAGGLVTVSDAA